MDTKKLAYVQEALNQTTVAVEMAKNLGEEDSRESRLLMFAGIALMAWSMAQLGLAGTDEPDDAFLENVAFSAAKAVTGVAFSEFEPDVY